MTGETNVVRTKDGLYVATARPAPSGGGSSPIYGFSEFITLPLDAFGVNRGTYEYEATFDFPTAGRAHIETWATGKTDPVTLGDATDGYESYIAVAGFGHSGNFAHTDVYFDSYWYLTSIGSRTVTAGEFSITFQVHSNHEAGDQIQWGYAVMLCVDGN
jgi:hypothetical protein